MHYKYMTEDELNYADEEHKKYEFTFRAEGNEKGYWNRNTGINLLLNIYLQTGEEGNEFCSSVLAKISSRLLPGSITSVCYSAKVNGFLKTSDVSEFVNSFNEFIDITAKHISRAELYKTDNHRFVDDYNKMFEAWKSEYNYS